MFWSRPELVQKYINHGDMSSCSEDDTIYEGSETVEDASEDDMSDIEVRCVCVCIVCTCVCLLCVRVCKLMMQRQ